MRTTPVAVTAALLLALGLTACSTDQLQQEDGATPAAAGSAAATAEETSAAAKAPVEEPEPAKAEKGTRENPYAIGETVANDTWSIVLGQPHEAWGEIQVENQFNTPPADGMEYWIVPVTATYTGSETGSAAWELTVNFVGDDNKTYDDHMCGVVPNDLMNVGELYPGGVAEGNACVVVPAGAPGLFSLSAGLLGEPVFFSKG